jgi:hypothetical protein
MIALVAVSGAPVFHPAAVLAASGTVSQETPLHELADPAAPVITLLPEGTIVSIEGPPVDGFYPVTASDRSGWLPGESMQIEKDPAESEAVPADGMTPGNDPVAVDAAAPAPELASTGEVTQASTTPDGTVPPPDPAAPAGEGPAQPRIDANVTPIPVAEVTAVGPASVIVDAPILAGPGPDYGFIATAPSGSMVEKTGHVIDGYATVQYAEVTGWVALEHLGVSDSFVAETPPSEAAAVAEPPPVESPPAESPLVDPAPAETPLVETPIAETSPAATVSVAATPSDAPPVEAAPIAAT